MSTKLESVLDAIRPPRTYEPMRRRAYDALNHLAASHVSGGGYEAFINHLVSVVGALDCALLGIREPQLKPDWFGTGHVAGVLRRVFGPSGLKLAYELSRTGKENGFYGVSKRIALHMADEYAENGIKGLITNYWNGLSVEEKLAAPDEYLANWSHMIPEELTEGSAGRIRSDFPKMLIEHAKALRKLAHSVGG